ncbi:ABC transporter permease (plasmid) [Streptomyces sp. NBC_00257]|uniref:ABC transporter permease n=1 Tax=unclassified Streptomyces TaxID=2593676 RepID=UPI00225BB1FB|nr:MULTISPECIES: ABC transporter permease [unclassified Streptomyces]MCX4902488.1 ABC transporter permease [Streptomyces sp. NBC_00892]MCX5434471.1 ABC transporter permease [Streptomyces sp. NBC_00062]WSP52449.1 ABC transporter permease [Streptomyces sp. NBC_01243]
MTGAIAVAGPKVNPWLTFGARRLGRFVVSLWALVTMAFLMIHLIPGDPVRAALGLTAPIDLVNARRAALGLDRPLWQQYLDYVGGLFHGDFGTSMLSGQPVGDIIATRLPATLQLALPAFVVVVALAIPLGLTFAVLTRGGRRRGSELAFTSTTVLLAAIPEFLVAVVLVAFFAVQLGWFPVAGHDGAGSLVLPIVALTLGPTSTLSRIVRVETLSVLGNDFIRTARAKRLPARLVYLRHALPSALTATLTLGGLMLTTMVAGTVLVENVFAWPGLGSTISQSILQKDYPLVQGIVLVYGIGVLLVNLVVDLLLAVLDPRSTIREN